MHFCRVKGKLHSKIISSDMKDFFPKKPMVKVRGRNLNGKTVKNSRKISGDDAARPAWVITGARRQQFAATSRFWSIPNLMPRSIVTHVWLTWMSSPGSVMWYSYTDIWQFFFFFCRFVSVVWQDSDRVQSVTQGTWYSRRSSMLSSDSWLIDIGERSHPNPMHRSSQFAVAVRSSLRFDDDVLEVNCTWTAPFSWRVKEAALWFESYGSKNLTGGTTWSSQSTSTDWLTRTHHWSSPRSKLVYKKPTKKSTSTRKLRKFPVPSGQGSKHRDWTASRWWARWRSQSSSCQHQLSSLDAGWFQQFTNILIQSRDLAMIARWHQCGTMTSQMLARASFPSVWLSSRSNFNLGPAPSDSTEKTLSYQSLWFWSAVFL